MAANEKAFPAPMHVHVVESVEIRTRKANVSPKSIGELVVMGSEFDLEISDR